MNDIPLGFMFSISQNNSAMHFYSGLSQQDRQTITNYIQNCPESQDVKERINNVIDNLAQNNLSFLNNT